MIEEQARFADGRPAERARREGEPLFSITTAIYDVDPRFVVALADSIWASVTTISNGFCSITAPIDRIRSKPVATWRLGIPHPLLASRGQSAYIIGGNRFLSNTRAAPTSSPSMGTISFTRTHCGS